jgi:heavy metal sensor kinase
MRSIRLSLVVYFLGLLVVALGVASVLVYRSAQRILKDKERAARELIRNQYEQRERQEHKRLDDRLLAQAQLLAQLVKIEVDWSRLGPLRDPEQEREQTERSSPKAHRPARCELQPLGLLTARLGPNAHVAAPLWLVQSARWPLRPMPPFPFEFWRRTVADLKLYKGPLESLPAKGETAEYYQIDSPDWTAPLRSASLGELSFPDPRGFAHNQVVDLKFDNIALAPDLPVRRVRLKADSAQRVFLRPSWLGSRPPPAKAGANPPSALPRRHGGRGGRHPERSGRYGERPPRRSAPASTAIIIQCAADTRKFDAAVSRLRQKGDAELADLHQKTADDLTVQRNRLLLISSATFAATVLGAFSLVWLGLLPLRRLSEAVGRVSPRDFRLPLDADALPRELRPIAQRLGGTLEMLERAFAREKRATADISHELRTPLAALLTTTELALRKQRTPEQYRELLADCRTSAQQMNQIVERLLTLARLDAGVDLLRPGLVDVGALAEQCAAVVRPLAEARGLRLAVHNFAAGGPANGAVSTPRLTTDPDKLREVLTNLLHNAIQYNRDEGSIDVTVGRSNGHVEVAVADTGIGIAPEVREHIFERFYRADPARNTDGLHAGLGLAIVKEYVELMGGSITVDSAEGQGSTFRLQLPVR